MRVVKTAAVQLSPVLYGREGTVEKVVRTIHDLGHQQVEFATFPETVVPYYPYFSFVQSPVQKIVGPASEAARSGGSRAISCHGRHRRGCQAGEGCRVARHQRARQWNPVQHAAALRRRLMRKSLCTSKPPTLRHPVRRRATPHQSTT
jgi:predicted amidohydrolase